jgi:hypothetical protein
MSETSGVLSDEKRIWVSIDWKKAPKGTAGKGKITFSGSSSAENPGMVREFNLSVFNPATPAPAEVRGFVESNGYISIEAEHFSRKTDGKEAGWAIIEGLGRTGSSVTVLPPTVTSIIDPDRIVAGSPRLEYDLYTFTTGKASLQLNCIPSFRINADYGLRIAMALDDNKPQVVAYKNGNRSEMDNLMTLSTELNIDQAGAHTLKIWMVDPGIVIDKLIINTGGVKKSYLGPPESFSNRK